MKLSEKTFKGTNVPRSTLITYSISAFFYEAFFEFITLFAILYVQLASPITATGDPSQYSLMLMVVVFGLVVIKIMTAFFYTMAGHLLEKLVLKIGKYRGFIIYGSITTSFFFVLLFFVAPLFSGWVYVSLFIIFYILMELCYAFNDIAFWAFLNTLTRNEKKRGVISCAVNAFSGAGCYLVASLSPAITAGDAKKNLSVFALALVVCYLICQLILGFVMYERKEDEITAEEVKILKESNIFSPFKILFSDGQIFMTIGVFFLLFLAQDCLIANSSNYFYFEYGYGSFTDSGFGNELKSGGFMSCVFIIVFGIANVSSTIVYPFFAKRFTKKQIMIASGTIVALIYLFMFFYAFRRGHEISLFAAAFCLAFFHGMIYSCMFLNCINSSEYYQYKYHARRNGDIISLKNVAMIMASAIQTGLLYLFLFASGLLSANSSIGSYEALKASGEEIPDFINAVNQAIIDSSQSYSNDVYLSGITLLPMILTVIAVIITVRKIKVNDEKNYQLYVEDIMEREKALKAEKAQENKISK
ncbi:MAG: MFS transporter [Bacilli bacterium]